MLSTVQAGGQNGVKFLALPLAHSRQLCAIVFPAVKPTEDPLCISITKIPLSQEPPVNLISHRIIT